MPCALACLPSSNTCSHSETDSAWEGATRSSLCARVEACSKNSRRLPLRRRDFLVPFRFCCIVLPPTPRHQTPIYWSLPQPSSLRLSGMMRTLDALGRETRLSTELFRKGGRTHQPMIFQFPVVSSNKTCDQQFCLPLPQPAAHHGNYAAPIGQRTRHQTQNYHSNATALGAVREAIKAGQKKKRHFGLLHLSCAPPSPLSFSQLVLFITGDNALRASGGGLPGASGTFDWNPVARFGSTSKSTRA